MTIDRRSRACRRVARLQGSMSEPYREYAEEFRLLAKRMPVDHRENMTYRRVVLLNDKHPQF
jgi:hypothetical protein